MAMAYDHQIAAEPNPEISALAEVTVPAAALMVPGYFEALERVPEPDDFDDADLAALWTGILEAHRRGPLSKAAVARQLREMGFEEARCFAALARVQVSFVTMAEALEAARILLDRRLRRQATVLCLETAKTLATAADVQGAVQRHEKAVGELAAHHDGGDGWQSGADVHDEAKERLETGWDDFDRVSGGLPVADLTIVAGRPGMGKTAFAVQLALNVARAGYGVGFLSLEMTTSDLLMRGACAAAYQSGDWASGRTDNPYYDHAERGFLQGDQLRRYTAGMAEMRGLPIMWNDRRGLDIDRIRLGARRLKATFERKGIELKLLLVDHLGKIETTGGRRDNRHQDLTQITNVLNVVSADIDASVVALAQLSRKVEEREDKRPILPDLRESGSLEENAHSVVFLYRPAYYDEEARERGAAFDEDRAAREAHHLEAHLAKNRGGERRRVILRTDIGCNAILDKSKWKSGGNLL
jgi:replicative DNA helicase